MNNILVILLLSVCLAKESWQEKYEVQEIKGSGQLEKTRKSHEVTVVEFYTQWCIDCKKAAPELHKLSQEYKRNKNVKVVRVDIDLEENQELRTKYNVMSIPALGVLTKHSARLEQVVPQNEITFPSLRAMLEREYPTQLAQQVESGQIKNQKKQEEEEHKILIDEEVLQQNYLDLKDLKFGDQGKQELFHSIVQISDILSSKMDHNKNAVEGLIDEIVANAKQKVQENNDFEYHITMTGSQMALSLLAGFVTVIVMLALRRAKKI